MIATMMGGAGHDSNSQENADAGDSSVLSVLGSQQLSHIQIVFILVQLQLSG